MMNHSNNNIPVFILAGGLGTRLSEETTIKPKPMVEVGDIPILIHIMRWYYQFGFNDFVICCGYKGYVIKEYFANYFLHKSDVTIDLSENRMHVHNQRAEPWKITLVDTGETSMTGGRLKRVAEHVLHEEAFCFTYGDGVSDINIQESIQFHLSHRKLATLTATYPAGRFGAVSIEDGQVKSFMEKPKGDGGLINGGFFVLSPEVLNYIDNDDTVWEQQPLINLANEGQLMAYEHHGFWQPMDTLRDKMYLDKLWNDGQAPWKTWE